jgi:hypothetical protein
MTHFIKPPNDPISEYLRNNYSRLKTEFFEEWFPNIRNNKPQYMMQPGKMLYENTIKISAVKLSKRLLDKTELKLINFPLDKSNIYPMKTRMPEVYAKIPTWTSLLETYSDQIDQLFVDIAYPGASISSHYGVSAHCYRLHLCLQNNPGFIFKIEDESKAWTEGPSGMFMFDDGNLYHGVTYNSEFEFPQSRIVVILDILKDYYEPFA